MTERPAERPLKERLAGSAAVIATILGCLMIGVGALLAATGRPESSLIWTGTVVFAIGVLSDRLPVLRLDPALTLDRKKDSIGRAVRETPFESPSLDPAVVGVPDPVRGAYWSQPAVDTIVAAIGADSRPQLERALDRLVAQILRGDALVRFEAPADRAARLRAEDEIRAADELFGDRGIQANR